MCRRHLNSDVFQGNPQLVKKIRQCCLINGENSVEAGFSQKQLAEVLGVDRSLVCRAAKKANTPLSPVSSQKKRAKRSNAIEISNPQLVDCIKQFWVLMYSECSTKNCNSETLPFRFVHVKPGLKQQGKPTFP